MEWDFEIGIYGFGHEDWEEAQKFYFHCGFNLHCAPYIYGYDHFFSRYPLETTKMWNLICLFTPESWMWTFLAIFAIILSLNVAKIISMKIGLSANETEEIVLIPFRFLMKSLAAPSLRTNPHTHT